jgi:hypothetical protein
MERFDPELNPAISHIMLFEQALGLQAVPQAYLCCSHRQNQTRIYCVHLPSRYTSNLDGQVMPWDGLAFAFLGDIVQGQVTSVILPATAFRTVHNVRASNTDYIVAHLEDCGAFGLPQLQANDPESNLVTTRNLMYLLAKYVPLLLNATGYTIRQLWEILYPAIVDANVLVAVDTLLKWMRVVTTSINQNQVPGPTTAVQELQVPLADENLISHRMKLMQLTLPGLYRPEESL